MARKVLIQGATNHTPVNRPCKTCKTDRQHEVLHSTRQVITDDLETITTDYQIVICLACKSPAFRMQVEDSDMFHFEEDSDEIVIDKVVRLFP